MSNAAKTVAKKIVAKKPAGRGQTAVPATMGGWTAVRLGNVTVGVRTPTPVEFKRRMQESKAVVLNLRSAVGKTGVRIAMKASTPLYEADPDDPNLVIRKLNGKATRGHFKDGVFVKA